MSHVLPVILSVWNLFGLLTSEKGSIGHLAAACSNGGVTVSFQLEGLDRAAFWKALSSGEEVVFNTHFTFYRERRFWLDETLFEAELTRTLNYNNLTRQFRGHSEGMRHPDVLFNDMDSSLAWLRSFSGVFSPPDVASWKGTTVFLQVKTTMEKRRVLYVIPFETVSPAKRVRVRCQ